MSKWISTHIKLILYAYIALSVVAILLLSYNNVLNPIYIWLIFLAVTIAFFVSVNIISYKCIQKISSDFESTCIPYEYIEFLTKCYKNNPKNTVNQMNYAVALLLDKNNIEKARMVMELIQVEKIPFKQTNLKYIYYNNLCIIYLELNELAQAEEAYKKALYYYKQIKNEAYKAQCESRIASLACELAIKKEDIEKALSYLTRVRTDTLLARVSHALALAKIQIMQNEAEKAREQLNFVIEHGQYISEGQEAKELLSKLT